jgi:hypothetical protein
LFRIEDLVVLVGGLVFGELRREFDAALAKIAISRLKQRWARQVVSARVWTRVDSWWPMSWSSVA